MGVRTDWSFEPIASGLRMLLGNGKPDDLFVPTRDVRGRRVVPYRSGGRMGLRCVTQWVEFCADLAESGGAPVGFRQGTISSKPWRVVPSRYRAGGFKSMISNG